MTSSSKRYAASVTHSKIDRILKFNSLRTQIAASYGVLIVAILTLGVFAIGYAFNSLLIEQAKANLTVTSDEIARVAEAGNALGFYDPATVLDTLANKEQLDHWASPTQYVQIDTVSGYPIGKSSNMGDLKIAPLPLAAGAPARRFTFARDTDGVGLLVLDRLFARNGKPVVVAHVAERLEIINRETLRARYILVAAALLAGIAVVIASIFIARNAVEPIARLTVAMEEIGSERLDRRLRWQRSDELGTLAATFDAMLDRLQAAFARERQFISDASHELKTPLTVINANAQLLRRWGDRDAGVRAESIKAIIDESARLADMVGGMLTLAKADAGDRIPREPVSLAQLAADVVSSAHDRASRKGLVLRADIGSDGGVVLGDAALLRQLIANLVDNAIKFTERGSIVVSTSHDERLARVEVRDTGIGIAPDTAERLFDRFFRADSAHSRDIEGTGLGLAIVRSIARVHGGIVRAWPRPEGGSIFAVELPTVSLERDPLETLTENQ